MARLDLEMELINPERATALLEKIEEVIPKGFEVVEEPLVYRIEGCNINMKGKDWILLKEEVRLSLRSERKGSLTIEPTVRYGDENGNAKSHQPEPITITVKEMGIKGKG